MTRLSDTENDTFPFKGSIREQLRHVLRYAVLAPSIQNTQPWMFRIDDTSIEVYADRSRALGVADPTHRDLMLSVGAAIHHLRLALKCHLLDAELTLAPDTNREDVLARFLVVGDAVPEPHELKQFASIKARQTLRGNFHSTPVSERILEDLQRQVSDEQAGLVYLRNEVDRGRVTSAVVAADETLWSDGSYRRERRDWIRSGFQEDDGVQASKLGAKGRAARMSGWLAAALHMGDAIVRQDGEMLDSAPAVAIVVSRDDSVVSRLYAGQAISRLALAAAAEGLFLSYFSEPIEVENVREHLVESLNLLGFPQIVIRLGYGDPTAATPRRPVNEVLIEARTQNEGDQTQPHEGKQI